MQLHGRAADVLADDGGVEPIVAADLQLLGELTETGRAALHVRVCWPRLAAVHEAIRALADAKPSLPSASNTLTIQGGRPCVLD